MRRTLAWGLAAPLALLGSLTAHSLAYRVAIPDAGERARALAQTGHGWVDYAPLAAGIFLALAGVAFAARVVATLRGRAPERIPVLAVALVPPAAFMLQEYFERVAHTGTIPWGAVLEPSVLAGLALVVPFALAAGLVAQLLARWAERVARWLAAPLEALPVTAAVPLRPALVSAPRVPALARGWSERGPPALS
jgi:hypothetical protein